MLLSVFTHVYATEHTKIRDILVSYFYAKNWVINNLKTQWLIKTSIYFPCFCGSVGELGLLCFCCRSARLVLKLVVKIRCAPCVLTISSSTWGIFFSWWITKHKRPSQTTYLKPVPHLLLFIWPTQVTHMTIPHICKIGK